MTTLHKPTPWHLWVVGLLGLFWNGFGATDYTMSQLGNRGWFAMMGYDGAVTDAMLAYLEAFPVWAHAGWALGVWGGVLGCLLLLRRNRLAVPALAVSLIGAVLSFVAQRGQELPPELAELDQGNVMYVVIALAVFLLWYAWTMRKRGLLS